MTDKKIEEIIDKKFETCWVDKRSAIGHIHKDRIEELKSELNTELQKAVEEAVEGFVKWQFNEDNPIKMQRWNIIGFSLEDMLDEVKEYQKSEK